MIYKIVINIFVALVEVFAVTEVFRKSNRKQKINWILLSSFFVLYLLLSAIATLFIPNIDNEENARILSWQNGTAQYQIFSFESEDVLIKIAETMMK